MSTKAATFAKVAQRLVGMVNIHGQPIVAQGPSFQPVKRPPPSKLKTQTVDAAQQGPTEHHGFRVFGFSPSALAAAERGHDTREADRVAQHRRDKRPGLATPKPFDAEAWMNSARPEHANPKPYVVRSAADQCAELVRKAGWVRVTVAELKK